jgi:hypothetical protein
MIGRNAAMAFLRTPDAIPHKLTGAGLKPYRSAATKIGALGFLKNQMADRRSNLSPERPRYEH